MNFWEGFGFALLGAALALTGLALFVGMQFILMAALGIGWGTVAAVSIGILGICVVAGINASKQ